MTDYNKFEILFVIYDILLMMEGNMKYHLIIDKDKEEEIIITCHEKNEMIEKIEKILDINNYKINGYCNDEVILLDIKDIYAFSTKQSKVYACVKDNEYLIKERIYQVESILDDTFIKINQGCIININKIQKFNYSIGGAIKVILKNGFQDYVSRRELKNVKRRLGL